MPYDLNAVQYSCKTPVNIKYIVYRINNRVKNILSNITAGGFVIDQ